jgi:predicted O-linked N-acetylglucosamine transferase (SPINDLY family)
LTTEEERLSKRNDDTDYKALVQTADGMYNRGSYDHAIEVYTLCFKYLDESFQWDNCELYRKLGDCYFAKDDMDGARKNLEKTLDYSTTNASVYMRLASIYYSFQQDKGIEYNDRAFALDNNFSNYGGRNFLTIKTDAYTQLGVKNKLEEYAADWPKKFVANGTVYSHEKPSEADRHKKLKIAYISSDFYNHTMMSFVLPLIEHHDTEKYEIILYSTMDHAIDGITTRIMKCGNRFVDCSRLNNFELAKQIYDDGVDILVDLGGFTHNRSFALLFKPAPIQAQYMGFLNTYGFKEIDYILTDDYTIPKDKADLYTETPLYIEAGMDRFNFTRKELVLPDITPLPAEKKGYITFGSFNDLSKITISTIRLWSKLLLAVPDAKLLIYRYGPQMTPDKIAQFKENFQKFGISEERLEFSKEILDVHFKAYLKSDIALDPTPFGGLSITIEALHMGVPTLTMPAEGMQSRGTGRINRMLGIEDAFNASDEESFAQKGAALAADMDKLRNFRNSLREKVETSPLKKDLDGFARSVEAAYERAWQNYCESRVD